MTWEFHLVAFRSCVLAIAVAPPASSTLSFSRSFLSFPFFSLIPARLPPFPRANALTAFSFLSQATSLSFVSRCRTLWRTSHSRSAFRQINSPRRCRHWSDADLRARGNSVSHPPNHARNHHAIDSPKFCFRLSLFSYTLFLSSRTPALTCTRFSSQAKNAATW